jgi:phosphoglycolate phosphatase
MKYRAVLFDLDGTLLDTLEDLAGAVNRGLALLGLPQHKIEAFKYFVGDGREEMASRALPDGRRDRATLEQLVDFINQDYALHWSDHTCLYRGVSDLLDELARRGLKMNILSNKPHDFTLEMASVLLKRWHFESVCGAQPSVPNKPDCTQALQIARRLAIPPSEFIYLGDSDIDMQTAVNAGMFPAGALWGFRTAQELTAGGARVLIDYPTDLLHYLQECA